MTSATKISSSSSSGMGGSSNGATIPSGLSGVLVAPPTASTPAGYYIQIAGSVPSSPAISYGDVYSWDGTAAALFLRFAQSPDVLSTGGETYRKHAGVWVSDALLIDKLLSSTPTLATPAGWYIQVSGSAPIGSSAPPSLNDIYYWPAKAGVYPVKYLSYADAPTTVNVAGVVYRKNNGGWLAEIPALTSLLGTAPTAALAAGHYAQIAGVPPAGISLGDIFYWSGTAGAIYNTYSACSSQITAANSDCVKWQGTWVQKELTLSGVLTVAPTATTAAGFYTQIGGIPPSGVSLGDLFYWTGSAAQLWMIYANAPDLFTCASDKWQKIGGTWVPRNLSVSGILFTKPASAGFFIQQTGVLPGVVGGGTLAFGDIYWYIGTISLATKYLSYADAPNVVTIGDAAYAKTGKGSWSQIGVPPVRNYYPIVTQFQEGSKGLASTFIPIGSASVVDLASQWNGGNLLRIVTDRASMENYPTGGINYLRLSNSSWAPFNNYVRQLINITPGVDNTYFLKTISDAYRWSALQVIVCDKITGAPVYRCHAQSGSAKQDAEKFSIHMDSSQNPPARKYGWEWFGFTIPQEAIDANLMSGNQLMIALVMDNNCTEGFFYVDGWAVAANPYSFTYTPAVSMAWSLEAPRNYQFTGASWSSDAWQGSGYVSIGGSVAARNCSIPVARTDRDLIVTFVTNTPTKVPDVYLSPYLDAVSLGKFIGVPSTNLKSHYNPPTSYGWSTAAIKISAADLQTYCQRYVYSSQGYASMPYLRFNLVNKSVGSLYLSHIYSEIA